MSGYDNMNNLLNLMGGRLGYRRREPSSNLQKIPSLNDERGESVVRPNGPITSIEGGKNPAIEGIKCQSNNLLVNGGYSQQDRMVLDKKRSLDRALLYSYQGANIKKVINDSEEEFPIVRALINPNKLKQDYDDKIISVPYEDGFKPGDVFEWVNTNSYWLIYLQDLDELAYFRGDIRRCSYEINWEDENGLHSTHAAVRGPVETKINYIQKHQISIDIPNYSLNILMPKTEETLKYFRRYTKFYLQGADAGSQEVCWRVEAIDWISTPGILEVTAVEYYINEAEDDLENGVVGGLIVKENKDEVGLEDLISGENFIKPRKEYVYTFIGDASAGQKWFVDNKKYPVKMVINEENPLKVTIRWLTTYSGQFELSFGNEVKTIVVESLF